MTESYDEITPFNKKAFANDGSCGDNACSGHGICFREACYCDMYHFGDICEADLAHPGVKTPLSLIFYAIALVLGLTTGGFVAKIYNEN